jgi:hypothetical protein
LGLRRQIAKARFIFEGSLLVCQRKIAVTVHPLGQMLLVLLWANARLGPGCRSLGPGCRSHCPWRLPRSVHRRRLGKYHSSHCRQD